MESPLPRNWSEWRSSGSLCGATIWSTSSRSVQRDPNAFPTPLPPAERGPGDGHLPFGTVAPGLWPRSSRRDCCFPGRFWKSPKRVLLPVANLSLSSFVQALQPKRVC